MIVNVVKEDIEISEKFAHDVIDTNQSHYAKRNQSNRQKIIKDITVGKLAEFCLFRYFKSVGVDCTEPDVNVYGVKKKSFDADLIISGARHIHIKSQLMSSANRYGISWMFQKSDKLLTQPKKEDYIAVCLTKDDLTSLEIKGFFSADSLVGKYGDPKVFQLSSKKSLYWNDIHHMPSNLDLTTII